MEEFKGDKRTKEYREWKKRFEAEQSKKSDGLGDVIKKVTKATGIDKLVEFVAGEDCGCDDRKEKLNKIFKFSKPKCLLEDEYEYLKAFFSKRRTNVTFLQRKELYNIYNRVFGTNQSNTTCPSCVKKVIGKLDAIYRTYK